MGLGPLHTIREEPSYAECVQRLGGYTYIDTATENLIWRLSRDPVGQSFAVPELKARITFTEGWGEILPVLRVILRIEMEPRIVSLLWIEEADDAPPIGFDDFI